MEQYQIRLIEEYRELDGRIQRLSTWLSHRADELTAAPGEVTDRDFSDFCLMFRQLRIMAEYRQILYTRLDAMHLDPCSSAPDEIVFSTRGSDWISAERALPYALQNVIVCTNINTVTVAWINGDHWTFADTGNGHLEDWTFDDVKCWMPMPEPPAANDAAYVDTDSIET